MLEIIIALIAGFALGYVFASGFPADGAKRQSVGGMTAIEMA